MHIMVKLQLFTCSLFALSLSCPLLAVEDEEIDLFSLSLQELLEIQVGVATKTSEASENLPAIITVITSQDIRQYGYQSVAEALSHVTGFIDNYDLALHNFGVRGINSGVRSGSRTVKFMVDGNPIALRSTSQNFIDQELIPMSLIDRVEIVRGPVSALYGANAFLGVVNVVTKQAQQLEEQGMTATLSGSQLINAGTGYQGSLIGGRTSENFQFSGGLAMTDINRRGIELPRRSPNYLSFNNTSSTTSDDFEAWNYYGKASYRINPTSELEMTTFYQRLEVDNTFTDLNALLDTGPNKIGYDNYFLKLNYHNQLTDTLAITTYSTISAGGNTDQDKVELGAESFFLQRRIGFHSLDVGSELMLQLANEHSLLLGIESRQDAQKLETFSRVERATGVATPLSENKDKDISNEALYAQYLFQLSENWSGVLGYRLDQDSVIGQQGSSRVGIVGQLPWDITLKILAGSAFQAPSPELLFRESAQAGDIIGNEDLNAQKAKTVEISMAAPVSQVVHLSATVYQTKVEDLVSFSSNTVNLFAENSTNSDTQGFELEGKVQWNNVSGYLNYFYQDTSRERDSNTLSVLQFQEKGELFPEQGANLGISYFYPEASLTISLNHRWVGSRPASTLNIQEAKGFYELDEYLDGTLTVATSAVSLFEERQGKLMFQVQDLYDSNYVDPGFGGIDFPSLGRRFTLTLEQNF